MQKRLSAFEVFTNPVHMLAYTFGSGLSPYAPGTAGTLIGVIFYIALSVFPLRVYVLVTLFFFVLGIFICGYAAKKMGMADPGAVNWDELVGFLLTMTVVPHALWRPYGWVWIIAGFVLFRIFDILKPWPIRWFDRHVHGGFGIMLDDLLAAIPSAGILYIVVWIWPKPF